MSNPDVVLMAVLVAFAVIILTIIIFAILITLSQSPRDVSFEELRSDIGRTAIGTLSKKEIRALKDILARSSLTGDQIRSDHPKVDFNQINCKTGFLEYEIDKDIWHISDQWEDWLKLNLNRFVL